jgi:hypothetical protein
VQALVQKEKEKTNPQNFGSNQNMILEKNSLQIFNKEEFMKFVDEESLNLISLLKDARLNDDSLPIFD